jgi:hypothetical protein
MIKLLGNEGFSNDFVYFLEMYNNTIDFFIDHRAETKFSLQDGDIIVAGKSNLNGHAVRPFDIHSIFLHEGKRFGYEGDLIYAGGITILQIRFNDKNEPTYYYMDNEAIPIKYIELAQSIYQTNFLYDWLDLSPSNKASDFVDQIDCFIKAVYLYDYVVNPDKIWVLEGS